MKLLLTSAGIRNQALAGALLELAGAPAAQLNLAFIPTAANIRDEDKGWLVEDLALLHALGFAKLDIVDLAALPREQLIPRLEQAHILVFGGGSTEYLLASVREKLAADLTRLLQTRVLTGISAGSVMCCPFINPARAAGLGLVGFEFVPHMGSPFARRTREDIQGFATALQLRTYWADDSAGVLVDGGEVRLAVAGNVEIIDP